MSRSSNLESTTFRRLTGRKKPQLHHPTSNKFNIDEWTRVFKSTASEQSARDSTLFVIAILINKSVRVLRDRTLQPILANLSADDIIALAIASANRAFALIRQKARDAQEAASTGSKVDIAALSHVLIQGFEGGPKSTPDDYNNAAIDSLPHWFALAKQYGSIGASSGVADFGVASRQGSAFISLENAYRSAWQEVLWSEWHMLPSDDGIHLKPADKRLQENWAIWDLRQQTLLFQGSFLSRQLEKKYNMETKSVLGQTVVHYDASSVNKIILGSPSKEQNLRHRSLIDSTSSCYAGIFWHQKIDNSELITPALLTYAILFLQDLCMVAFPEDYDVPAEANRDWISSTSCSFCREDVVGALSAALNIEHNIADKCISFLSFNPLGDLSELFLNGIWHQPIAESDGGTKLLVIAGALMWVSPVRRFERWLQIGKSSDLSKTSNGLIYEKNLREIIKDAVDHNRLFNNIDVSVSHLPASRTTEEIDMIIRIGKTIIVCEVKCILAPSDPIERYDYIRKLEEASSQAKRKSKWLIEHAEHLEPLTGYKEVVAPRIIPLIIVNQSNGMGEIIDGCHVTDAHFLQTILADGKYHSGTSINEDGPGSIKMVVRQLYENVSGAEACIPDIFVGHPALEAWRRAIEWRISPIPLHSGSVISMHFPFVDHARYAPP